MFIIIFPHHVFPSRFQVGLDRPVTQTFKDLLTKLSVLENAYSVIEKTISSVDAYMKEWLDFLSLWDLQPDALDIKFGEDICKWMCLLSDIKKWSAFNEIMWRKDSRIQNRVNSIAAEWEKNEPVEGALKPDEAFQKLAIFESKYLRLKEERDNVGKAKQTLELQEAGPSSAVSVQQMDLLLNQLKDLPARLLQYASYEYVMKLIQSFQKVNTLIVVLKSDALKDQHWKTLGKQLRVSWVLADLILNFGIPGVEYQWSRVDSVKAERLLVQGICGYSTLVILSWRFFVSVAILAFSGGNLTWPVSLLRHLPDILIHTSLLFMHARTTTFEIHHEYVTALVLSSD